MPNISSTIVCFRTWLLALLLLVICAPLTMAQDSGDPRIVYRQGAASWLSAIGQLRVPSSRLRDGKRKHFYEDCSATLVQSGSLAKTDYILTAWHCLEHYQDLSRSIVFTLPHPTGSKITRRATIVAEGGSMAADWALLRLESAIDAMGARPLPLSGATTTTAGADTEVTMAGFSRDGGLGQGGKMLTYDPQCSVLGVHNGIGETNCVAFKGSSGGPALRRDAQGGMTISGVISQGNGAGLSTYISTSTFASTIIPLLAR